MSRSFLLASTLVVSLASPALAQSTLTKKQHTGSECGSTLKVGTGSVCGPALFQALPSANCSSIFATDSRCPPALHHVGRGPACGAELHFEREGHECGTHREEFWSDWGHGCPGAPKPGWAAVIAHPSDTETRVHRRGWKVDVQKRHKCFHEKPHRCRHPNFGVELWRECRSSDFGVEQWSTCHVGYDTCRSPNHPVEAWNTCADKSFGEEPQTCDLYLHSGEIDAYMASTHDEIKFKVKNAVRWAAVALSATSQKDALGCVIKRITTESGFAGDVVFDDVILKELQDHYKNVALKNFELSDYATCTKSFAPVHAIQCTAGDTSAACNAITGFKEARTNLEEKKQDLIALKNDIVARKNKSVADKLAVMEGQIDSALNNTGLPLSEPSVASDGQSFDHNHNMEDKNLMPSDATHPVDSQPIKTRLQDDIETTAGNP